MQPLCWLGRHMPGQNRSPGSRWPPEHVLLYPMWAWGSAACILLPSWWKGPSWCPPEQRNHGVCRQNKTSNFSFSVLVISSALNCEQQGDLYHIRKNNAFVKVHTLLAISVHTLTFQKPSLTQSQWVNECKSLCRIPYSSVEVCKMGLPESAKPSLQCLAVWVPIPSLLPCFQGSVILCKWLNLSVLQFSLIQKITVARALDALRLS